MRTIGIDPDTKALSIALWAPQGPEAAFVIRPVSGEPEESSAVRMIRALKGRMTPWDLWKPALIDVVAIEGQQVDRRRARPRDLFTLAHVTGAVAAEAASINPYATILIPTPSEWKGSVAKHAMQARLYTDLGWGYTLHGSGSGRYAVPSHPPHRFEDIRQSDWKHVGDALLLARWAQEQA